MLVKKVYIDLETLPPELDMDEFKANLKPPANIKKQETKDKWLEDNWLEQYKRLAVNTDKANICSLGMAVEDNDVCLFLSSTRNEKQILKDFYEDLILELHKDIEEDFEVEINQNFIIWVGFNNKKFDLDLLWKRAMFHGLYDLCKLIPRERYSKQIFDIMEIWNPFEYNKMVSQDNICKFFGIEGKPDDIDGSQIYDTWQRGEYERIGDYNIDDVEKVRKLYKIISKGQ
jgi:hypothetical protein